jgi:hypothetical protein
MMMERVGDIGKNGRMLLDRPKPTAGCSANGGGGGGEEEEKEEEEVNVRKSHRQPQHTL